MTEQKKCVPEIRFAGFTDDWEQRKLGEVLKIKSGMSQKNIEDPNGIYPILATGGEIGKTNTPIYSKESVLIGRKGTIDKPYYMNTPFWTVDTLFYSELAENISGRFIYNLFQKINWKTYNTSTGVPSLTSSTIHNIEIKIPKLLEEQTAIGNFFKQLDDTIASHQRVLEKYQNLKISYLEKMFPKENEAFPALRFPQFTDAWEQRKLGDVVDITMGQSPDSKTYTLNPADFILVQGNADIKNGWVVPRVWTTEMTKLGKRGELIMSVRAPVGDIAKTDYDIVLGRGVCAISGNEFIYQLLSKMKQSGYWESISTGSTFDSINSNDIKKALISVPSLEEQTAIGNFFKQLDDTIASHQREVEKYQKIKQAYLEKMFV